MRRYLVVANQTLGGSHLVDAVRARLRTGPSRFHVLVPASPSTIGRRGWRGRHKGVALRRLRSALDRFRELGVDADGEVGDHRPMDAIDDALRDGGPFDEIIISTLPRGRSRWLKHDLAHRVEAAYGVPVTHVEGQPEPVGIG